MELVLDVETSIFQKGNPFADRNKLCLVGLLRGGDDGPLTYDVEHGTTPYGNRLSEIQHLLDGCVTLIGFNLKFDLHWLKRYNLDFSKCRVWDCQLVEFILDNQRHPYPSLNGVCEKYGLGKKLDTINEKYWSQKIW